MTVPDQASGDRTFKGKVTKRLAASWASRDLPVPELWMMGMIFLWGASPPSFFSLQMVSARITSSRPTYGCSQELIVARMMPS